MVTFACQIISVCRTILAYFEDTVDKNIGGKDDCCDICRNRLVKKIANIDNESCLVTLYCSSNQHLNAKAKLSLRPNGVHCQS